MTTQALHATQSAAVTDTARKAPADRVETRITDLHKKLRITQAQSAQWENVAQVMRSNAREMKASITERSAKSKTMTAMDDLRSYQGLANAHSDGLNKFVPVFASLYDSMSVEQKKNADAVFQRAQHHPAPKTN